MVNKELIKNCENLTKNQKEYGLMNEHSDGVQSVVKCIKCKNFDKYNVECMKNHNPKPPYREFYCADGEREDEP